MKHSHGRLPLQKSAQGPVGLGKITRAFPIGLAAKFQAALDVNVQTRHLKALSCKASVSAEVLVRRSRLWALNRVLGASSTGLIRCHNLLDLSPGNAHRLTRAPKDGHPLCVSRCLVVNLHLHRQPANLLQLCNCTDGVKVFIWFSKQASFTLSDTKECGACLGVC